MIQSNQALLEPLKLQAIAKSEDSFQGIIIASAIVGLWVISLIFLLLVDISRLNFLEILFSIAWQTFLYTGLFITAHDAMHGVVFPKNCKINNFIGSVAVWLYALFSYEKLLKKHWLHHKHPATAIDPDFHDTKRKNFFAWYFHFMKGYASWQQIVGLMFFFYFGKFVLHVPEYNLILFWSIPALLSSLQLFYFGTFLTHREPEGGYTNPHRAQSNPLPVFWSFITCYHFGYHKEHHEYPHVPWWKLPEVYYSGRVKQ